MATYQGDWATRSSDMEGYAYNAFKKFFGREPTDAELAQATAAYQSGDPNRPNVQGGDAFVAQMFQNEYNAPDKQYAREQEELKKKSPEHYGSVEQLFQTSLGRAATQEEKDHFGSLLASGQLDAYQLGQFVQALPESVRKQDAEFRQGLSADLQAQDARYFNESVLPGITSSFAQRGRSVDSSGYAAALAQAATGQNRQREQFLSNLTAQQYGGSQAAARENYMNTLSRYQGMQDYSRQRMDYLADQSSGRLNDINNLMLQKNIYDQYLRNSGRRNWMDYANVALHGLNTATNMYTAGKNPWAGSQFEKG